MSNIEAALTPNNASKRAYAGKLIQKETFTVQDPEGNPIHVERDVIITWETIEAVLSMVRKRANIKGV